jgi:class 3 adenylate cyclase
MKGLEVGGSGLGLAPKAWCYGAPSFTFAYPPAVAACPACGFEYQGSFKFCPECATPLSVVPARSMANERKFVTALFCDLIAFTATSESADPEDVDKMLAAYSAVARNQIEAHGGVVEKFIGDAVVGVFGVPVAHEDDPERAVRAGLRIADDAENLQAIGHAPLRLRVGINTGEVLVRLGVSPGSGERFLAGDVINSASRIQSVAPEMGVAVGLATYDATTAVFDYEELEAAQNR